MGLALGQLQVDGAPLRVHKRVDPRLCGDRPWSSARPASDPWFEGERNCPGDSFARKRIGWLFLTVGGVLVNPDRRAVDHLDIAVPGSGPGQATAFETSLKSIAHIPARRHRLKRFTQVVWGP